MITATATARRTLELLAAGEIEPGDTLAAWGDGTLATSALNVQAYPDVVEWRTVVAVDGQCEHVHITFSDSDVPVTLPADDDVVALTTPTA